MKLEELTAEVDRLTEEERASLASHLLQSLEIPVHEVPDEEVMLRVREAEEHPEVMISWEELATALKRSAS